MSSRLCVDIGFGSLNKYGEEICGDHVEVVGSTEGDTVVVLADGLGSGVKAGILSTLTSKIISTMMANSMSIEECVATVAATLPVCSERQIAYSTFTILRAVGTDEVELIQYDSPQIVFLREGKSVEYRRVAREYDGKTIYTSRIPVEEGDVFIAFSDGVEHAGAGNTYNFGWQREHIAQYMQGLYHVGFTAKTLTTILLDKVEGLYEGRPGDDATVCTMRIRGRVPVNLMIGPPARREDEEKMMSLFFSKPGKHIVCGGTTSNMVAEYLGETLVPVVEYPDPEVPPIAKIRGVDLVTEGVITFTKVLAYAQNHLGDNSLYTQWGYQKDGASQICRLLFEEATDINFYVGRAVNPAHQSPDLSIGFSIKMHLVEELSTALKAMGKNVKVSYF